MGIRGRGAIARPVKVSCKRGWSMRYENAGMSSEKAGENPAHRKSKISWVKFVFPGLVGP